MNRGEVKIPSKQENINRLTGYFNTVEFEKWDDLDPPIIKFSGDGGLAYAIVNKEVVLSYLDENNKKVKGKTIFAWVAIY